MVLHRPVELARLFGKFKPRSTKLLKTPFFVHDKVTSPTTCPECRHECVGRFNYSVEHNSLAQGNKLLSNHSSTTSGEPDEQELASSAPVVKVTIQSARSQLRGCKFE
jgi:hypothetical protein